MYISPSQYLRQDAPAERDRGIYHVFAILTFSMIFLQKLGISFGGGSVGIDTGILCLGLGWLVISGRAVIPPLRLLMLGLTLASIAISLPLSQEPQRLSALGIMLTLYIWMVPQVRLQHDEMLPCLNFFQRCMVVIAGIVLAQQVVQYTIGNRFWPNLDHIIPVSLQYPGFAYIHPYAWGSPYNEPNGVFFLEPSGLSLYLALALVIEIVWFQRLWRLALFAVATLACLAVTGPATLILTVPLWIGRLQRRLVIGLVAVGLPLLVLAAGIGMLNATLDRTSDLSNRNSSGYARIIIPLKAMGAEIADPDFLVTGAGPGMSQRGENIVEWPFSKLLFEYGLLTAMLFHAFLLVCVFDGVPAVAPVMVILIPYLIFGGGFVAHTNVLPLVLFGSLPRLRDTMSQRPRRVAPSIRAGRKGASKTRRVSQEVGQSTATQAGTISQWR